MPTYELVAGVHADTVSYSGTAARYVPALGTYALTATEANVQIQVYNSYTLAKMFVRVDTNSRNGTDVLVLRVNSANTSVTVTATGPITGTLEDTTNTAAVVSGDLLTTRILPGTSTSGLLNCNIISYTQATATPNALIASTNAAGAAISAAFTRSIPFSILGIQTTETKVQYTWRTTGIFELLRIYVSANATTTASSLFFRQNAANTTVTVAPGAGLTGEFEDTLNTVTITAGDEINFRVTVGATGALTVHIVQIQGRTLTAPWVAADAGGVTITLTTTDIFNVVESQLGFPSTPTESLYQLKTRSAYTAQNMQANAGANTSSTNGLVRLRVNTADSTMLVTVTASTTGIFEDTSNTVAIVSGNLINYSIDGTAGTGTITFHIFGIQEAVAGSATGILVDWNANGDFTDDLDDITGHVISARWRRGRDAES